MSPPTATISERLDSKHLWRLIKDMRLGMLTHRHPDGSLRSHPLTTQNRSLDEGCLYFFITKSSGLGQWLQVDGDVNVAYADPHKDHYVSISGHASLGHDRARQEHLFNAMTRAWFPKGLDDPELEFLEVRIGHAEFWDVKESKVTQLVKLASAAISGQRPAMGEHKEVHFG